MSRETNHREGQSHVRRVAEATLSEAFAFGSCGLVYGLAMVWFGYCFARVGEGTFYPILVFSFPFGLASGCISFLAPPMIWGTVGICLAEFMQRRARILFLALVGLHYVGLVFLSIMEIPFDDFMAECRMSPATSVSAIVVYGLGQLGMWAAFFMQFVRYRIQFTIRSLLIGTAILAAPIAWLGGTAVEMRRDSKILSHLAHLEPEVGYDFGSVTWLVLCRWPASSGHLRGSVTDDDLRLVGQLRSLRHLRLMSEENVTDAGLAHLKGLTDLRDLDLYDCRIGDMGLRQIAEIPSLERLDLRGTRVTDSGLKQLAVLKNLQRLDVRETSVTDAGVQDLKRRLPQLEVER